MITTALVIGASNKGLNNADIPKYMRLSCGTDVYLDNTEPRPQPIVIAGITRPPVSPEPIEIIQFIILPKTLYTLNLNVVTCGNCGNFILHN